MKTEKQYSSFKDFADDFSKSKKSVKRVDVDKLNKSRNKFAGVCKCCGETLSYIYGTNIVACKNEKCKGIEYTVKTSDGDEKRYRPVSRMLDEKGMEIALGLFEN